MTAYQRHPTGPSLPRRIVIIGAALALSIWIGPLAAGQKIDDPEIRLQAAMHKEQIEGELEQAIELYKSVLTNAGSNHSVAAKALLQIGACYEKLGKPDARQAYERVVLEYSDRPAVVADARARLAALGAGGQRVKGTGLAQVAADLRKPLAVSDDGKYLAFVDLGDGDLAIRDLATGKDRRVTTTAMDLDPPEQEYAANAAFSPDGRQLAYGWYNGRTETQEIRVVGREGGEPRKLRTTEKNYAVRDWSPDGKQILASQALGGQEPKVAEAILLVSVADGTRRVLKTLTARGPGPSLYSKTVAFSPDGRYIAYDYTPVDGAAERDVFVFAVDGSGEAPLVQHPANDVLLGWFPDGNTVLFGSDRSGTDELWAIRVSGGRPQGAAMPLRQKIGAVRVLGITKASSFYYHPTEGDSTDVYLATWDPTTGKIIDAPRVLPDRVEGGRWDATWSPDGTEIAFFRPPPSQTLSIHTLKTGQVRDIPLKLEKPPSSYRLTWLPDGREILVHEGSTAPFRVIVSTGTSGPYIPGLRARHPALSRDGKTVFYERWTTLPDGSRQFDVVRRDTATGDEARLYLGQVSDFALSPDEHWLAIGSMSPGADANFPNRNMKKGIYVVPAAGGPARLLLDSGTEPARPEAWSADGKYVLFLGNNGRVWRIAAEGGKPAILADLRLKNITGLSLHPDGRRLAITGRFGSNFGGRATEVWVIENLLKISEGSR